mgnify:CR=1 FL=1
MYELQMMLNSQASKSKNIAENNIDMITQKHDMHSKCAGSQVSEVMKLLKDNS